MFPDDRQPTNEPTRHDAVLACVTIAGIIDGGNACVCDVRLTAPSDETLHALRETMLCIREEIGGIMSPLEVCAFREGTIWYLRQRIAIPARPYDLNIVAFIILDDVSRAAGMRITAYYE